MGVKMFNKILLGSIILDKRKLKKQEKNSCIIECIPTMRLLSADEQFELVEHLNKACDLLRKSYIISRKR